jgi:hypothetical protein|tara:strand:- start:669 stop:917 length:249 start_codon:yes stop_codon:yes gene_type:complete
MFVLTDTKTGGIYAVNTKEYTKSVTVFEDRDDAQRYVQLLEAEDYEDNLEVMEVDKDVIAVNCKTYGYSYSIIEKDDLIVPP